jgi:uncharacterized protein (DUF1501 family)
MANPLPDRRQFLRQAACSAVGTSALVSTIMDLYAVNAAAQSASDYKALVCIFLFGGNDSSNMLVPRAGGTYAAYAGIRGALALPGAQILPITPQVNADGIDYGLHPSMIGLQALFQQGRVAFVRNVGTLIAPVTRSQYLQGGSAIPTQLFSHSDQQLQWQTSYTERNGPVTGWGGRIADLLTSLNGTSQVSLSIALNGSNTFQVGRDVYQLQIAPWGTVSLEGYDVEHPLDPETRALSRMIRKQHANVFESVYAGTVKRALDSDAFVRAALESQPPLQTVFPETWLGAQLQMAARMIQAQAALGQRRQIFFCGLGGWDTHDEQMQDHADLLAELSAGMTAFFLATAEIGKASEVTTFTASDFGRTFASNGRGSDHGWGGHHIVMGGAVQGGRLYGRYPQLVLEGPDDTDFGRWIPSTSVDEYAATLARWFGVSATDMPLVFPNIGRFASPNLGFMG